MLSAYRGCLGRPHVKLLFSANLVGRLPNGMAPLGIVLLLRSHGAGFGRIGVATAVFGLFAAVGGPLLGRVVDRFGQLRVLAGSATASACGFVLLVATGGRDLGATLVAVCVAGLFSPPLEPCLRAIWPSVLDDGKDLATAYALDASLQEVVFVAGPLLVVLIDALTGASGALIVTAAVMLAGTAVYVLPAPVRHWRAEARSPHWAGALRSGVLRRLLLAMVAVGVGLGALNIDAVAYQEHVHRAGLSGVVLGANAAGALVGGLYYGARTWRTGNMTLLVFALGGLSLGYLSLVTLAGPVATMVLAFVAGLFLSPVLACCFAIIGESALPGTTTEAFAWMIAAVGIGNAAGSSAAGEVTQALGLRLSFLLPGVAGAVAVAVALALSRFAARPVPTAVTGLTAP